MEDVAEKIDSPYGLFHKRLDMWMKFIAEKEKAGFSIGPSFYMGKSTYFSESNFTRFTFMGCSSSEATKVYGGSQKIPASFYYNPLGMLCELYMSLDSKVHDRYGKVTKHALRTSYSHAFKQGSATETIFAYSDGSSLSSTPIKFSQSTEHDTLGAVRPPESIYRWLFVNYEIMQAYKERFMIIEQEISSLRSQFFTHDSNLADYQEVYSCEHGCFLPRIDFMIHIGNYLNTFKGNNCDSLMKLLRSYADHDELSSLLGDYSKDV